MTLVVGGAARTYHAVRRTCRIVWAVIIGITHKIFIFLRCGRRKGRTKDNKDNMDITSTTWRQNASMRHIDEFVASLSCAGELLDMKLFPDTKEVTESMAAFHAYRTHLGHLDPKLPIVVVGDGSTPRTGALFCYRTQREVYSCDPQLNWEPKAQVRRLTMWPHSIFDVEFETPCILVLVHAHVDIRRLWSRFSVAAMIMLPCCNWYKELPPEDAGGVWPVEYEDLGILTPHRMVRLWAPGIEAVDGPRELNARTGSKKISGGALRKRKKRSDQHPNT